MPLHSSLTISGQGLGDTIRVWWNNKKLDNSTAILSSTNYLRNGYFVCWAPNLTDPDGNTGLVVARPETRNLTLFAGIVVNLPDAVTGQAVTQIDILPWSTKAQSAYVKADLTAAATTTVLLSLVDGSFAAEAAAAMTANAAGTILSQNVVAAAVSNGTDSSSTAANQTVLVWGRAK